MTSASPIAAVCATTTAAESSDVDDHRNWGAPAEGFTGARKSHEARGEFMARVAKRSQFFKTRLCPWMKRGKCMREATCNYAHSHTELRVAPDLTRTRLCPTYFRGTSCSNKRCHFAHTEHELRATDAFYKTRMCFYWYRGEMCPSGRRCRMAHGPQELRHNPIFPMRDNRGAPFPCDESGEGLSPASRSEWLASVAATAPPRVVKLRHISPSRSPSQTLESESCDAVHDPPIIQRLSRPTTRGDYGPQAACPKDASLLQEKMSQPFEDRHDDMYNLGLPSSELHEYQRMHACVHVPQFSPHMFPRGPSMAMGDAPLIYPPPTPHDTYAADPYLCGMHIPPDFHDQFERERRHQRPFPPQDASFELSKEVVELGHEPADQSVRMHHATYTSNFDRSDSWVMEPRRARELHYPPCLPPPPHLLAEAEVKGEEECRRTLTAECDAMRPRPPRMHEEFLEGGWDASTNHHVMLPSPCDSQAPTVCPSPLCPSPAFYPTLSAGERYFCDDFKPSFEMPPAIHTVEMPPQASGARGLSWLPALSAAQLLAAQPQCYEE